MRAIAKFGVCAAFVAVSFVCSGTAAVAQDASKLGPQPAEIEREGSSSGDEARRTMYAFAACVLKRHRKHVIELLSLPVGDSTITREMRPLADAECLANGVLQFDPMLFRGSLYVELYRVQFGTRPADLKPTSVSLNAIPSAWKNPGWQSFSTLFSFADCVTHRDPSTVRAMVLAGPGSRLESVSLTALSPEFQLCLVKGNQMRVSKSVLTGLLAEALYRQSVAPVSVAPVSAAAVGVSH